MTDHTDARGADARAAGRESARAGDGGSPVGSPVTIVLAMVAVVLGFLIFRSIDDGEAGGTGGAGTDTVAADPGAGGTTAGPAATTAPPAAAAPTRSGATVVVINANKIGGSAGAMTDELEGLGYTVEQGITSNDDEAQQTTVVWFAGAGAPEAVARQVAADLGGVEVESAPSPLPILQGDSPGAASVFVYLGTDLANQELPVSDN